MAATFCIADTEDGRFVEDPGHDVLAILVSELNRDGNTFVTLNPADDSAAWYASVFLLPDGAYEVDLGNPDSNERTATLHTDHNKIAQHVSDWLDALQRTR